MYLRLRKPATLFLDARLACAAEQNFQRLCTQRFGLGSSMTPFYNGGYGPFVYGFASWLLAAFTCLSAKKSSQMSQDVETGSVAST